MENFNSVTTLEFVRSIDIDHYQSIAQLQQLIVTAENRLNQLQTIIRSDIARTKQHYLSLNNQAKYHELDRVEHTMYQEANELISFIESCEQKITELSA